MLVADGTGGGAETGNYVLHFAKTSGVLTISPGDEGGIPTNGAAHPGVIAVGDLDAYQIEADVGASILLHAGDINTTGLTPWVRLFSPDGIRVGSNFGPGAGRVEHLVQVAGTYTVAVSDGSAGVAETGDYVLHVVTTSGALTTSAGDDGGIATNGGAHPGVIGIGDLDGYQIDADIGESILAHAGDVNTTGLTPWIRLFSPAGIRVGSNFGPGAAQVEHLVQVAGTYTVAVSDGSAGAAQNRNSKGMSPVEL